MVIKVDKSEEFKKSGKKLISEYECAKGKDELWDENESNKRMDVLGQNGNTGLHYLEDNPRPEEEIADWYNDSPQHLAE